MEVDAITNLLTYSLIGIIVILFILSFIYLMLKIKSKKTEKINSSSKQEINSTEDNKKGSKSSSSSNRESSVMNFMEFEKIEDNMIIQKTGFKYLMVVECQGVNYDLMSEVEKAAVEEGFMQFLNTLRHPIQIYVQTRPINLEKSINVYQEKLKAVEDKYLKTKRQYDEMNESEMYTDEQKKKAFFELTKITNLYEYGKDIIADTQKMSLNKNILSKKYYIIIPYYPSDLGNNEFDAEEIKSIAFSELYTKAQAIIRTLSSCSVNGKILNSSELVELLYMAYNRDEAEVFGLDRALRAEFDQLYATAPDVLDKKMKALNEKIERLGIEKAKNKLDQAKSEKERMIEDKEQRMDELINQIAKIVLEENKDYVGEDLAEAAINKIDEEAKGGKKNVKEKQTKRRANRQA